MNVAPALSLTNLGAEAIDIRPDLFGRDDFDAIVRLIHAEAGITLAPSKTMLVFSRLAPLVRAAGCATFGAYIERITADTDMRAAAVSALTTNHTFFYREAHHFEHFAADVRPGLLRRAKNGEALRLWSAGCSSGEECWSLAATLLGGEASAGRKIAKADLLILASDISDKVIARARAAEYPLADAQALPAPLLETWFDRAGDRVRANAVMRSLARFNQLNLMGKWPMRRTFAVIFCRNVMIYFDEPTKQRLVSRFAEALDPGGTLYIGHSERVTGEAERLLDPIGPTIYRRRAA